MILNKIVEITINGHDTRLCGLGCKYLIVETNDYEDIKRYRCYLGREDLACGKIRGDMNPFRCQMCVMSAVVTKWGMIDDERATALLLGADISPPTQGANDEHEKER